MEKLLIDLTGWAGSILVVLAYAANSYGYLRASSRIYQLANVAGSICLIINTWYYQAYPSTMVNIVWVLIGGIALLKSAFKF